MFSLFDITSKTIISGWARILEVEGKGVLGWGQKKSLGQSEWNGRKAQKGSPARSGNSIYESRINFLVNWEGHPKL